LNKPAVKVQVIHPIYLLVLTLWLSACLSTPATLPPEPTFTAAPSATATPTVVWFPPTATFTPMPTQQVTPTTEQNIEAGVIIFTDDFTDPSLWALGRTATTSIALGNGVLTLALDQPHGYLFSLRQEPVLDNFYFEITAAPNLCRDFDEYGVLLRASSNREFYRFSLSCNSQVRLDKYFNGNASSPRPWMISGAVPPGAPSSSRLGVWAEGKEMRFYINNEFQFSVSDPSLVSGTIGVFIRSAGENAVTVSFSDLVVREIIP